MYEWHKILVFIFNQGRSKSYKGVYFVNERMLLMPLVVQMCGHFCIKI